MKYLSAITFVLVIIITGCSNDKTSKEEGSKTDTTITVDQSLELVDEKLRLNPNNAELLHERALLFMERKRYQDALVDMQKVLLIDSTKSSYFMTMADLAFAAKRSFEAKENLEKALALDPENTEVMMRLAELYLIVRQHTESVALLNKVLAKDKSNTTAWLMRGINFKENSDTNRAIGDFRSAIEANSDYYEAYMQLGMIFQLRNDPISEGYYTNAIRIRPQSEEALYGRGLWYQDHNQLDKAIQDYTSILQINPNYKTAHFNLGYIHQIYLKVYTEAIKHYGRAIQVDPQYAEAFYNRGLCYEYVGNIKDAASDFKSALTIRPDYPPASQGLERVTK